LDGVCSIPAIRQMKITCFVDHFIKLEWWWLLAAC
jgi:hypothetical protein